MIKHLIKIDGELFEIPLKVYNHLEQQKIRADQLEKRWSELKNTVNEFHQEAIIEVSKCKDEGDKGIVYACEKILGKISYLEEDSM